MTKHQKEAQAYAKKALEQYELGNRADAKKLAKRVSWRTLFLEAYDSFHWLELTIRLDEARDLADKLKGIEG